VCEREREREKECGREKSVCVCERERERERESTAHNLPARDDQVQREVVWASVWGGGGVRERGVFVRERECVRKRG
jgi:hypothetical protein